MIRELAAAEEEKAKVVRVVNLDRDVVKLLTKILLSL